MTWYIYNYSTCNVSNAYDQEMSVTVVSSHWKSLHILVITYTILYIRKCHQYSYGSNELISSLFQCIMHKLHINSEIADSNVWESCVTFEWSTAESCTVIYLFIHTCHSPYPGIAIAYIMNIWTLTITWLISLFGICMVVKKKGAGKPETYSTSERYFLCQFNTE